MDSSLRSHRNVRPASPPGDPAQNRPAERRQDDTRTLQDLLAWCEDDADATLRISRLLAQDNDPETADAFRQLAVQRGHWVDLLTELLNELGETPTKPRRTLRSRLFRMRLWVAERVPVGYNAADDRRFVLRLARTGSDLVKRAYEATETRSLSPWVRKKIDRQARDVELANRRVRHLLARASLHR